MKKVITYGTFDLLHHGHVRLLERAKSLGDYLIVGVTADTFDLSRGKINVRQTLTERMEAVRATGIADEIIVEEYEGQKIDDIKYYDIDIFTVGSDWVGTFDYLNAYCQVVYLERTAGVSSTEIRKQKNYFKMGIVGESNVVLKYVRECSQVNGLTVSGLYTKCDSLTEQEEIKQLKLFPSFHELLEASDVLYVVSHPKHHYMQVKTALQKGKHVLCESPIALSAAECDELFALADEKHLVLMEAIKTAYATAYNRLSVLLKSGKIGKVVSVDATCTSLRGQDKASENEETWNSICAWGPTAALPIFQLLGTNYRQMHIATWIVDPSRKFDAFSKIDFLYDHAVASIKVGKGVKSEGNLVISGTKGYLYVPSPWWKTDYFEVRYENSADNQRYFFQLDGEGIRNELVAFIKSIESKHNFSRIDRAVTTMIAEMINTFESGGTSVSVFTNS